MKELSVIIPTHNRAAYLAQCVASVRGCGMNAEIIIVDDGSTDEIAAAVRELGDVVYLRQAQAGPAAARNAGVARSRGRFLAFLDSDDRWRPGVVGQLYHALWKNLDIDVAFADAIVGNPSDGWKPSLLALLGREQFDSLQCAPLPAGLRRIDRAAFFCRMVEKNQVFLGSALIRRSAFETLGGFDPELLGGEDYELLLRLAHRGPFAFLDEPLAYYLKHAASISADRDRMDRQYALVMQKVLARCPLNDGEREAVRQRRRQILYYLGYNSYDRGDYAQARERFGDLVREFGADPTVLAMWAACQLPAGLVRRLRRWKRSLTGAT